MKVVIEFGFDYWLKSTWFNIGPRVTFIQDLIEDILTVLELPKDKYQLKCSGIECDPRFFVHELLSEGQRITIHTEHLQSLAHPEKVSRQVADTLVFSQQKLSGEMNETYAASLEEFQSTNRVKEGDFIMFKYITRHLGEQLISPFTVVFT